MYVRRKAIIIVIAATPLCILCFFAVMHVEKHGFLVISTRGVTSKPGMIELTANSTRWEIYILINGTPVYTSNSRGLHVIVINQYTGRTLHHATYDTYLSDDEELEQFLNTIQYGRLLVFIIADEATRKMKKGSREILAKYGSKFIRQLNFRDAWVFICRKAVHPRALGESVRLNNKNMRGSTFLNITVELESQENACKWGDDTVGRSRRKLCSEYGGYGAVCNCANPEPIEAPPLLDGYKVQIPIAVMASNRPRYLFRMLKRLLATPGVDTDMVTVFIDGSHDEPIAVTKVFQLSYTRHSYICNGNCGISQHYKRSLSTVFDMFPNAKYVIIFEEDLDVSPDIMDYFKQLIPVLEEDPSLFCISASNALGYRHSCSDSSMLYRYENMPGLGWALKKKIFKEELEPNWPGPRNDIDWDVWLRQTRLGERECVVPDISRTYHFGAVGVHSDRASQKLHHENQALSLQTGIEFNTSKVIRDNYETEMRNIIENGVLLDHSKNPCDHKDFVPNTKNHTYILYILFEHETDYSTWLHVARCFQIWYASVRGMHKRTFRFWIKGNHVIVVGSTSPYAVYKPPQVKPMVIKKYKFYPRDEFH